MEKLLQLFLILAVPVSFGVSFVFLHRDLPKEAFHPKDNMRKKRDLYSQQRITLKTRRGAGRKSTTKVEYIDKAPMTGDDIYKKYDIQKNKQV